LGINLSGVLDPIDKGERFDRSVRHQTVNETTHITVDVTLRFVVVGHLANFDSWNVSLLVYNRRVDGFGYEQGFRDIQGIPCDGWHRHCWNREKQHAKGKLLMGSWPLDLTFKDFVVRAFTDMNVCLKDDYGTSGLL
jgi:hypothetical protein